MTTAIRKSVPTSTDGFDLVYWLRAADRSPDGLLLLLHGGASNHTRWSEFVDETRLSSSWDIAFPDLRGNGASMTRRRLDIDTWCADIRDVARAESSNGAVLVGHSLGAQLAMHYAVRFPRETRGLVLLDPVFEGALSGRQAWLKRNRRAALALLRAVQWLNGIGLRRRRLPDRDLRALDEETRIALAGDEPFEEIARRYGALGPILRNTPTANYLQQALATITPPPPPESVTAPVLALLSAGTTLADAAHNREQVGRFVNHDIAMLPANHWPLTETPVETREAIDAWVMQRFGGGR